MRRSGRNNKEPDSALSVVNRSGMRFKKQFKERCYNCGKIGHKGVDCWELDKNKDKRPSNCSSNFRNNSKIESSAQAAKNSRSFSGFCYFFGERGHRSSKSPLRKTEAVDETVFFISDKEGGVALFSFCPCVHYSSYQENTPENNENVEATPEEPIMHSNVVDLAEIVKNIDEKINDIGNKVDIITNHVDLVDEKCNMIVEDGEDRTDMMKSLANDKNTSSIKKLSKDFEDLATEMKLFFENDDKTRVTVQERNILNPRGIGFDQQF